MDKRVVTFTGRYRFLSNFYFSKMFVNDKEYKTNEHYFQAMKAIHYIDHERIRLTETSSNAKKLGRQIEIKKNWDVIKDNVMLIGLYHKFNQNPDLKKKLLNLDGYYLIEGNNWNDTYWGVCNGEGQNKLGKSLMKIRDYFLKEAKNE